MAIVILLASLLLQSGGQLLSRLSRPSTAELNDRPVAINRLNQRVMELRSAAGLALALIEDGKRALVVRSNNRNAKRVYVALNEEIVSNTCLSWFWIGYIPIDRND